MAALFDRFVCQVVSAGVTSRKKNEYRPVDVEFFAKNIHFTVRLRLVGADVV